MLKHHTEAEPIRIWVPVVPPAKRLTRSPCFARILGDAVRDQTCSSSARMSAKTVSTRLATALSREYPGRRLARALAPLFPQGEGGYRISKSIRDICIFAQHNLVNDPPFSQMDFISCRNVLIYFGPASKQRHSLVPLRPPAMAFSRWANDPWDVGNLFSLEDRVNKISRKPPAPSASRLHSPRGARSRGESPARAKPVVIRRSPPTRSRPSGSSTAACSSILPCLRFRR